MLAGLHTWEQVKLSLCTWYLDRSGYANGGIAGLVAFVAMCKDCELICMEDLTKQIEQFAPVAEQICLSCGGELVLPEILW